MASLGLEPTALFVYVRGHVIVDLLDTLELWVISTMSIAPSNVPCSKLELVRSIRGE